MRKVRMLAWIAPLIAAFALPALAQEPILPAQGGSPQTSGGSSGPRNPGVSTEDGPGSAATSGSGSGSTPGAFGDPASGDPFAGGGGNGGAAPGLGGFAGASGAPPGIIGDFPPISQARVVTAAATSRFPNLPTPVPPPKVGNNNPGVVNGNGTTSVLFKLTGLKISDNMSPIPQDRFFYSFNYFDNLNASVNRRLNSPIENLQIYHQLFGLEKTFFDGRASVGFRVPLNTITLKSTANLPGLGGSRTAPGDLSVFVKAILAQRGDVLLTGGLQVTAPTGPGGFGGNKYYSYFRDTQIQPFVGYLFTRDRFYLQGFSAINVPTTSRDVTLLFNDLSIGYYAYRATDPKRFLTAIVPTAEAHLTTPLNHRGFSATDLASTPDILNLTFGTNVEIRRRAILSVAYVTPVTGPKPFNAEFVLLLNVRFGKARQALSPVSPPPVF